MLEKILQNLPPGRLDFTWRILKDKNPLGRTEKVRHIGIPDAPMMVLHERLVGYLRMDPNLYLPFVTACRPGCSPRKNVERHRFNRYFYVIDLHSAYDNVNPEKLAEVLERFGLIKHPKGKWFTFIKLFCLTRNGGLVTGAPASPDLFNLYASELLDKPLASLVDRHHLTYTRYLDDLAFSSSSPIGKKKRAAIRRIVEAAGFSMSHHKSKLCDLCKGPIEITGVGLEYGGRLFVPKLYTRRIRGFFHLAAQDPMRFKSRVDGMMGLLLGITGLTGTRTEWELYELYEEFRQSYFRERYR